MSKCSTYKRALDLYQNIQFWHDQLYAKVRLSLLSLAGVLAIFSFSVGGASGMHNFVVALPVILKVVIGIAALLSILAVILLLSALTLGVDTSYSEGPLEEGDEVTYGKIGYWLRLLRYYLARGVLSLTGSRTSENIEENVDSDSTQEIQEEGVSNYNSIDKLNSVWSPAFIHAIGRNDYINKISNMQDDIFLKDTLRYVHVIGDMTHRKIMIVNIAMWSVFWVFILLLITVSFA